VISQKKRNWGGEENVRVVEPCQRAKLKVMLSDKEGLEKSKTKISGFVVDFTALTSSKSLVQPSGGSWSNKKGKVSRATSDVKSK